jgi:hypothetical protein
MRRAGFLGHHPPRDKERLPTLFSNLPAIATSTPYLAVWVLSVPRAREVRKSDQRGHLVVSRLTA